MRWHRPASRPANSSVVLVRPAAVLRMCIPPDMLKHERSQVVAWAWVHTARL